MNHLEQIMAAVGALSTLCTTLALLFPKTSRAGYWLAKIGADLKGHTQDTPNPSQSSAP